MRLPELIEQSYRFHRVLYVSLTEQCPLRCRHCFVESAPERMVRAPVERFRHWIDGIIESDVEALLLSGGEPFNHPAALRYALSACERSGKKAVVCTSGFWARSPEQASAMLASYPRFAMLLLSTDVYHEEFVALRHVRIAAEAALTLGIEPAFQVVDGPSRDSTFVDCFRAALGDDLATGDRVYVTPLSLLGRAERELSASERESIAPQRGGAPDVPCPWLGTPWLREDGVVTACPNLRVFTAPSHALHLGALDRMKFGTLSRDADGDLLIQALRTIGPVGIARMLPVREWGWCGDLETEGATICDVCHSLTSVEGLPTHIREALDERIVRSLRLLVHGELHPTADAVAPQ
jgi:organic radical activating enzyme